MQRNMLMLGESLHLWQHNISVKESQEEAGLQSDLFTLQLALPDED